MSLSGGSAVSDLVVTGIRPLTTESDWVADNDNESSITTTTTRRRRGMSSLLLGSILSLGGGCWWSLADQDIPDHIPALRINYNQYLVST